jgi:hypothetical protein
MTKIKENQWKHKGLIIEKLDGWFVSGWNDRISPLQTDTLEGMRFLINQIIKREKMSSNDRCDACMDMEYEELKAINPWKYPALQFRICLIFTVRGYLNDADVYSNDIRYLFDYVDKHIGRYKIYQIQEKDVGIIFAIDGRFMECV